ncbi:MAG: hypothetical protein HYS07_00240 [Chlamydiae bacterium]|nr:hypothetical protein [Chlamydiota bacterium]MBI3276336.1 hypothetical protein [Chlamydiota bacterium]
MKEKLSEFVQQLIQEKWGDQYALADILSQEYGYSLIFTNKKDQNRFSPTMIPSRWVYDFFVKKSDVARRKIEIEVEVAFDKEVISG